MFDSFDFDEEQRRIKEELLGIKRFKTVDGETLMNKQIDHKEEIISSILPVGLTLLAGAPKACKSFFTLNLCIAVAKGESILGFPSKKGTVLYLSFEDTEDRIQSRAMQMTDEMPSNFHFTNQAIKIDEGLIDALDDFIRNHPDTVLIAIDTLNYIRPESKNANLYEKDYNDLIPLHKFTQSHNVSLLVVHHTRKMQDNDQYNAVSGSTALVGAVDNYWLLLRPKRTERRGKLFISGRDVVDREIELRLDDNCIWQVSDGTEYVPEELNLTVKATQLYLFSHTNIITDGEYSCGASELSEGIKNKLDIDIPSNMIKKNLVRYHEQLSKIGLRFESVRTNSQRILKFSLNDEEITILDVGSKEEKRKPIITVSDSVTAHWIAADALSEGDACTA